MVKRTQSAVLLQHTCYASLINTHSKLSLNVHLSAISHCLIPQELHEHTDNQVSVAN